MPGHHGGGPALRESYLMAIRVLVVDERSTSRAGLRAALESHPLVDVVGEAADGQTTRIPQELAAEVILLAVDPGDGQTT